MPPARAHRGAARAAALGAYGMVVAGVLVGFLRRYPIPEFLPKAASLLSAAWLVWALRGVGRLALRSFPGLLPDRLSTGWTGRFLHGTLGFALLSFAVIVAGWALPGDLGTKIRVLFGLMVAASFADHLMRRPARQADTGRRFWGPAAFFALPVAGAVACFLSSFSPITHYDSLVYHLALPAIYLRDGAIAAVPHNLYSFFPAAAEMLFLFVLGALPAPEYVINLVGWALALVLGGAVAEWSAEVGGRNQGRIALFLWWTAPLVLLLSQGAYVDLPLAAATFAALRVYSARERNAVSGLALAGFLCGLAFSIKYTGAMTFLILFPHVLYRAARKELPWKQAGIFVLASAILPAPWLLKNIAACGNPVFPFLYQWLGAVEGWTESTAQGYFAVLTEYGATSNVLFDLFSWPFTAAGGTRGGFDVLGDFGWPVVLFFAPLAIFLRRKGTVAFLCAYALAHALGWFVSKPVLRFLIPVFPIGVVLAAASIDAMVRDRSKIVRWACRLLVLPWIVSNVFIYALAASELKLFDVALGFQDRRTFLRQRLAFFPTFETLNENLRPDDGVLVVGEQRTYHLKTRFVSSNLFAPSPIAELCNRKASHDELARQLREWGTVGVVVNSGEIKRLGGLGKFGFSEDGETAFKSFLTNRCALLSDDRGVQLYRID